MGFDLGNWIGQAAKSVGRPIADVAHAVDQPFSAVTHATGVDQAVKFLGHPVSQGIDALGRVGQQGLDLVGQIPVIGRPLEAIYDIQLKPFELAAQIASGKNVGQTALNGLRETVSDVRTAAPLIQSVIAVIPAVGPVASGMISASLAIAEGQPIDGVLEAGLVGAVPGGALAASAYNLGKAIVQGKASNPAAMISSVLNSAASAAGVQLPPGTASIIQAGIGTTAALARGEHPDQALLTNAMPALSAMGSAVGPQIQSLVNQGHFEDAANKLMSAIPDSLRALPKQVGDQIGQALRVGGAIGLGQELQSSMKDALVKKMTQLAIPPSVMTPAEVAMMNSLPEDERAGFAVGINVKNAHSSQFQIATIRTLLPNSRSQDGFDAAISMGIGQVKATPPHSIQGNPLAVAGFQIHQGIQHSSPQHAQNELRVLHPAARVGAAHSARLPTPTPLGASHVSEYVKMGVAATVGGVVGFQVAGPLGAAVGAVIGGFAGKSLYWLPTLVRTSSSSSRHSPEPSQV